MVRLVLKGIIFFMGIQSLFGKLQNEGIIEGSIKINYPILLGKVISIIKSDEFNSIIKNIDDSEVSNFLSPSEVQAEEMQDDTYKRARVRCFHHVVQYGETLSNLAEYYGVSWKVIKKINHISNERLLQAGQSIMIPNLIKGLG